MAQAWVNTEEMCDMTVKDNGPHPNAFDIKTATKENENSQTVAWTGKHLQVTLMSISVGESTGLEAHPHTDQFIRVDAGQGKAVMGRTEDQLDVEHAVSDGWSIQIPAGSWHTIINTGDTPLRLQTISAPVHHEPGIAQDTRPSAQKDESRSVNEPPIRTGQHVI
jgi:mannose-6-phosphate isomerase-like protein (cupin superfamily)